MSESSVDLPPTYVEGFHDKQSVLKIKYNKLQGTDLVVSHISLGGGAFSKFYGDFNEDEAISLIRDAIKSGINYIDTAPWYGQGVSETILGKALQGIPRESYYLATKVGRYELDFENMFDFSTEKTKKSFEKSLERLQLDYVDIIQVHDIEFAPSLDIVLNETLPCLFNIQKNSKARYIGVTGYPLSILREAVLNSTVKINTVLSYCRNTLIDSTLEEYKDFFRSKNIGVICAAAHGMGLFTNDGPQKWHPASDDLKQVCENASKYCKKEGVELGKLAIWHSMNDETAATHLIGMNSRQILNANLTVLFDGLTKHEMEVLSFIKEEYYSPLKNQHWEGVEVKNYWSKIKSQRN